MTNRKPETNIASRLEEYGYSEVFLVFRLAFGHLNDRQETNVASRLQEHGNFQIFTLFRLAFGHLHDRYIFCTYVINDKLDELKKHESPSIQVGNWPPTKLLVWHVAITQYLSNR